MAKALGRILQFIGWVWVIAGFVLPAFGLARPNIFPGFILIFVARALRTQAARHAPPEEEVQAPVETQRVLHTQRDRSRPSPTPPATTPEQAAKPPREVKRTPAPEPVVASEPAERDDIIERIALAGRAASEEKPDRDKPTIPALTIGDERKAPMTSAEMIAQAKKRWDTKS